MPFSSGSFETCRGFPLQNAPCPRCAQNISSAFTTGKTDLEFADSGEITVNLAGRDDLKALARSENPYLFTWPLEDGVPVRPGAEFVLDPATASAGFKVKKDATGLRLYGKGFMLIVR